MQKKQSTQKKVRKAQEAEFNSVLRGSRDTLSEPAKKYLSCMVDPRGSSAHRSVASQGGYYGQTGLARVKCRGTASLNGSGLALIVANPVFTGPYTDRAAVLSSDSSWTGTSASPLPQNTTTGVSSVQWGQALKSAAGNEARDLSYRCIAAAIYVWPTSAATSQNGTIHLFEDPAHAVSGSMQTLSEIMSHRGTRSIRAIQIGEADNLNVLNWHPRVAGYSLNTTNSEFAFITHSSSSTGTISNPTLVVVLSGDTSISASYEFEFVAVYETVGRDATGLRPGVVDSRGWDLISNTISCKRLSGYVGQPSVLERSYLASAWHFAKKLGGSALTGVAKAAAREITGIAGIAI